QRCLHAIARSRSTPTSSACGRATGLAGAARQDLRAAQQHRPTAAAADRRYAVRHIRVARTALMTPRKKRLDPAIFHLPVDKMREGYYSDKYFVRARELLRRDHHRPRVTMQVFGKSHAYLGGIDEAIAILKLCAERWDELVVQALYD